MSIKPLALLIALGLGVAAPLASYAQAMPDSPAPTSVAAPADIKANPFYAQSPLPYQYPQFDKITNADYMPGFDEGMRQQRAEMDAIANNPAKPTFDNTIVAMEKSGQMLGRTSTVFFNLVGSNTSDELEKIQADISPKLSAHNDAIVLNGKLFARVKTLYDNREKLGLNPEQKRLLWRYHTDFVRSGAS
jgi:peptidyl-dipeptidase Dcp